MNEYLLQAKKLITMHGETASYIKVTTGTYNTATGTVTNTESTTSVTCYRKHIKATQYNYPSLIGKDAILVYLSSDSILVSPSVNDKITFGSDTYTVESFQEHRALNQVVMYRIACYKG